VAEREVSTRPPRPAPDAEGDAMAIAANKKKHSSKLPLLLVAPALVLLALFTFAPAIYALYLSLMKLRVTGGLLGTSSTQVFAGLGNYASTFSDPEFWHSLVRMLLIAVIGIPATVVLATLFALCLDANGARLTTVSRLAIFLPYAVPGVIASLLWGFLYLPATSPIGGGVIDYFGNRTIFFTVANVAVWGVVGFNTVVLYTTLRAIPPDICRAAEIDGASETQIALRIKLPQIAPAISMISLFSLINALQLFNEPTTLKPLTNAITSTWVPLMRVYSDAFVNNNIYGGAASAFSLLVMTVAVTVAGGAAATRLTRRQSR
jgi:multiple sugar transport system permease protein